MSEQSGTEATRIKSHRDLDVTVYVTHSIAKRISKCVLFFQCGIYAAFIDHVLRWQGNFRESYGEVQFVNNYGQRVDFSEMLRIFCFMIRLTVFVNCKHEFKCSSECQRRGLWALPLVGLTFIDNCQGFQKFKPIYIVGPMKRHRLGRFHCWHITKVLKLKLGQALRCTKSLKAEQSKSNQYVYFIIKRTIFVGSSVQDESISKPDSMVHGVLVILGTFEIDNNVEMHLYVARKRAIDNALGYPEDFRASTERGLGGASKRMMCDM